MDQDSYGFGYLKRRIIALEKEQSLLGKRVDALEARLRAENTKPIPGDIGVEYFIPYPDGEPVLVYRMLPPEQEDDPR